MFSFAPTQAATTDLLSTANRNSSQTGELAMAAAEVVFRRMTLGGLAMVNPNGADHAEFARMVPEKTKAFSDAGSILASQTARIGQTVAQFMVEEASLATRTAATILSGRNPAGMMAAQVEAAMAWAGRLAAQSGALCVLAMQAQGAALAPIHTAATANVERLRA